MLGKLLSFLKSIFSSLLNSSTEEPTVKPSQPTKPSEPAKPTEQEQPVQPEQPTEPAQSSTPVPAVSTTYTFDTTWNYGYWKEVSSYADIKEAMVEAQKHSRPILIALSKPEGCNNCRTYWRNVGCDGVFHHDSNCSLTSKNHPIVSFAQEKRIVMLYVSPSKMPNIASKIMGKEYDAYLHKPVYFPIYLVVKVKEGINLDEVANDANILNAGNANTDTIEFIMGYIGISGKPVYDYQGNTTSLTVKANDTGWNVFKSNMESIFADTTKSRGLTL